MVLYFQLLRFSVTRESQTLYASLQLLFSLPSLWHKYDHNQRTLKHNTKRMEIHQ